VTLCSTLEVLADKKVVTGIGLGEGNEVAILCLEFIDFE